MTNPVPPCGESDERNDEYLQGVTPEKYYKTLVDTSNPLIIDVGAHHGESVRFFKGLFPNSSIVSFEPDPDNYRVLKEVCQEYKAEGGCVAINKGMGDKEGILPFYKQTISHLGSLIPINTSSVDSIGYAENANNKMIQVDITVQMNLLAATTENGDATNQVYNVAVGDRTTLNDLYKTIKELLSKHQTPLANHSKLSYRELRLGDVCHSQADISKAQKLIGYHPSHKIDAGLYEVMDWYVNYSLGLTDKTRIGDVCSEE